MDENNAAANRAYLFGPFRLIPSQHLLLEGDVPVRLGSRALEILVLLVERAGSLVSKQELIARVWPNTVVEEGNLKVAVGALRRALGDGHAGQRYLVNIHGRGYQFVAPVAQAEPGPAVQPRPAPAHNLPPPSTRLIGRAQAVSVLVSTLTVRRLLTVTGPAGIGKTTVALAVAEKMVRRCEHGVRFVDLATLSDGSFVATALANALGLVSHAQDVTAALLEALRGRQMLLVLDNCEHVVQAVAELVERILVAAPGVFILSTSREPLRVVGETLQHLPPLAAPAVSATLDARTAMEFPAVALFVERASACVENFHFGDADAPVVASICRKLEGIALAIELAASRVNSFALRDLAALLENRVRLLGLERRTASARHASLAAALDWSHELLSDMERRAMRRLAVFAGPFDLGAATAVTGPDGGDTMAALDGLVSKSLLAADLGGTTVRYRLLDSTRAYAAEKLAQSGELGEVRRRHAAHYLAVLEQAEAESHRRLSAEWVADHGRCIDDVRSALAWATGPAGNPAIGVALTIATIPLWTQLSLLEECRARVESVLADAAAAREIAPAGRMKLQAALGMALLYTRGPCAEIQVHWTQALQIAERLGDRDYLLRMLWGLPVYLVYVGDYRAALGYLRRLRVLARRHGDRADRLSGERLIATVMHYFGRQASARRRLERVLQDQAAPAQPSHITRFQFDQRAAAHGTLASMLWLQGHADQAAEAADRAIRDARAADHPLSLCNALAHAAIPVALYRGDLPMARQYLGQLLEYLSQNMLPIRRLHASCLEGLVMIEMGDAAGTERLHDALRGLVSAGFRLRQSYYLCALARGQALAGRTSEALSTVDLALDWCERSAERWFRPEALRVKGELLRARGLPDQQEVERLFVEALQLARSQGALAWELRVASSHAQLLLDQGRPEAADAVLEPVRTRFREGFDTADLVRAAGLASQLQLARFTVRRRAPRREASSR